jgi:hypothetical protein
MQLRFIFILLFILFVYGCSDNKNNNSVILDEDTFVDVLVDIHLTDAILNANRYRVNKDSVVIHLYYNDVLTKHNVTQKQIQNTIDYYTNHSKKFEKIYDKVSEKIVKLEEEYNKSIKKQVKQ